MVKANVTCLLVLVQMAASRVAQIKERSEKVGNNLKPENLKKEIWTFYNIYKEQLTRESIFKKWVFYYR